MHPTMARLRDALNRHDPEGMAACFAAGYRSEQPLHPNRGFSGRDQVAQNWSRIFGAVPDLRADVVTDTLDGTAAWTEWVWHGTHRDGSTFLMKGVTLMGVDEDGLVDWARLYMEPVEQGGADIVAAVGQLARDTR